MPAQFKPEDLIPHRAPMLLLDEIIEIDATTKTILAKKTIRPDEFFVQGHYPNFPIVPGVITCEAIIQSGAALLSFIRKEGANVDVSAVPVIARISNAKFMDLIRPSDEVILKSEITDLVGQAYYLKGSATVNGKVKAKIEYVCMTKSTEGEK